MMSFISSFENTNVVPDPKIFFLMAASAAEAAVVSTTDNKKLLANCVSTFFY